MKTDAPYASSDRHRDRVCLRGGHLSLASCIYTQISILNKNASID